MATFLDRSCFSSDALDQLNHLDSHQTWLLIKALWPILQPKLPSNHLEKYAPLFAYLQSELRAVEAHESEFVVKTWNDIATVIRLLYSHQDQPQDEIIQAIRLKLPHGDDAAIIRSMELSLRLCLTINIRSRMVTLDPVWPHTYPIEWPAKASLCSLISSLFPKSTRPITDAERRIDPLFTAAYLVGVTGIKIIWTDNLAEHLRFNHKARAVKVYQHKICLEHHLAFVTTTTTSSSSLESEDTSLIPPPIIREAIDTLNLLFPFGDPSTESLLTHHAKPFYSLGFCNRPLLLSLDDYTYWRDPLLELIEAFNAPPQRWSQLWRQRHRVGRNKTESAQILAGLIDLILLVLGSIRT